MRFAVIAAALGFAASVLGQTTIYTTVEVTVTSCAASVTDCPARSTVTSTSSYPVITSTSSAVHNASTIVPPISLSTSSDVTVTVYDCPATSVWTATGSGYASHTIASTGVVVAPTPSSSPITPVTGAASMNQMSLGLGAVAAIAAIFL